MEKLPQKMNPHDHDIMPLPQPELQIVPVPQHEIERKPNISPEALDDLIKNPEKMWDQDDERNNPPTPTIH